LTLAHDCLAERNDSSASMAAEVRKKEQLLGCE
jgi:hypothetical protein